MAGLIMQLAGDAAALVLLGTDHFFEEVAACRLLALDLLVQGDVLLGDRP